MKQFRFGNLLANPPNVELEIERKRYSEAVWWEPKTRQMDAYVERISSLEQFFIFDGVKAFQKRDEARFQWVVRIGQQYIVDEDI